MPPGYNATPPATGLSPAVTNSPAQHLPRTRPSSHFASTHAVYDNPILELQAVITTLVGVDGQTGLIADIDRDAQRLFAKWDAPFSSSPEPPDVHSLLEKVTQLLRVMRTSSLGAIPTQQTPGAPYTFADIASETHAKALFKERQTIREQADVATSVLSSN